MALQKQQIFVNFSKGLDTKSDPWQVPVGNFLNLENSIFSKIGRLEKRNGFSQIGYLPNENVYGLATFKDQLTLLGDNLYAFQEDGNFLNRGTYRPCKVESLSLIKNVRNHIQSDSVTYNDLTCIVYTVSLGGGLYSYEYSVVNANTGQMVLTSAALTGVGGNPNGSPRIALFNNNFVIVYSVLVGASSQLQFIRIPVNNLVATAPSVISTDFDYITTGSFDLVVGGSNLYLAWNRAANAGVYAAIMNSSFVIGLITAIENTRTASIMSLSFDSDPFYENLNIVYYDDAANLGRICVTDENLLTVLSPTTWINTAATTDLANIATKAVAGVCTIVYEQKGTYSYNAVVNNSTLVNTVTSTGTIGTASTIVDGNGLGSKIFTIDNIDYIVTTHQDAIQDGYFVNDFSGNVVAKFAYTNGDGYVTRGVPYVTVTNNIAKVSFLRKIETLTGASGSTEAAGINQANIIIGGVPVYSSEIGNMLNISGGFLWSYDGVKPVENNFFIYPENVYASAGAGVGSMTAQEYQYSAIYVWVDNQGNVIRSSPSEAFSYTLAGPSTSVDVRVPTLRLSYKTNVLIKLYRWSQGEQVFHLVATTNNTTASKFVTINDTSADSAIIGNEILYTDTGLLPNEPGPACSAITLFDNRLWVVDSEEPDLIWYSKIVVPGTTVEMTAFQTIYVSPTQSAQGTTGSVTALAPMDDKLIIFKEDAIYYLNGTGPDATGANNQYSEPIFITSTVGCRYPKSIVFIPNGLMFQSDKGIWLLGRDLSTSYIGAPVEQYTQDSTTITSLNIPNTNQVRFVLDSGITIMYDYFFQQWGSFTGIGSIAAALYQQLHTYFDQYGRLYKENPASYKDGENPVLIKFKTSWFALSGILGFQRAYFLFFLGEYLSPHKLTINVAYDFNPNATQQIVVTPNNYSEAFGVLPYYGTGPLFGGNSQVEKWRLMLKQQKCDSIQFEFIEQFDASYGTEPGAGFTLSGMNFIVGIKRIFNTFPASITAG
jgi:hypothetical protein